MHSSLELHDHRGDNQVVGFERRFLLTLCQGRFPSEPAECIRQGIVLFLADGTCPLQHKLLTVHLLLHLCVRHKDVPLMASVRLYLHAASTHGGHQRLDLSWEL